MADHGECPTACDADCDAPCHEVHEVTHRRDHQPERCPSTGGSSAARASTADDPVGGVAWAAAESSVAERLADGWRLVVWEQRWTGPEWINDDGRIDGNVTPEEVGVVAAISERRRAEWRRADSGAKRDQP